jgi:hypothetical protein
MKLNPKLMKAHFRYIKALLELEKYKEARYYLSLAIKEFNDNKEMKQLDQELFAKTGIPLRPNSNDFEILHEIGDGNFSKVYQARYKKTGKIYAVKVKFEYKDFFFFIIIFFYYYYIL